MLPFEAPTIFEQIPRFFFKMPRVHLDQKSKFESDELFRRLSRESEIRYTGHRDRPLHDRQQLFRKACLEGHIDVSFTTTGTNISIVFSPCPDVYTGVTDGGFDFGKEHGKVHLRSHFIMNGICVIFRGWIDLDRLDGVGSLDYDEERGSLEEAILKEEIERYKAHFQEMERRERLMERQAAAESEFRKRHGHELSPERTSSASN